MVKIINLWKYWGKEHGCRDFTLIAIDLYCEMTNGGRIVFFNVGIKW